MLTLLLQLQLLEGRTGVCSDTEMTHVRENLRQLGVRPAAPGAELSWRM